jgi:ParB-like chromosome segregation protein Spo0J
MGAIDPDTREVCEPPELDWPAGVHEAAELFPMLGALEFSKLVKDIDTHGQRERIIVDSDGRIIDGRNRAAACQRLGIEPRTESYDGQATIDLVISLNVHRRHLSPSQLAAVAVEALPLYEAEAKARQVAAGGSHDRSAPVGAQRSEPARAAEQAAAATGASTRNVQRGKRVKASSETVFEEVKAGTKTLSQAERETAPSPVDDLRQNDDGAMKRHLHKQVMTALVGFTDVRKLDPIRVAQALPDRDNQRVVDLLDGVEHWLVEYRTALAGADVTPLRRVK